ncbi:hypothetical protein SAY87_001842 [Trapa incisa]|uniref:poly(A)-specific ribonuclease n=1 Tax=Trapa incisa TaxID=236973 RepID=A0AAN7PU51_9MYRT|nr:hypothetical protein SAY87_001842 [Trapa incisa]
MTVAQRQPAMATDIVRRRLVSPDQKSVVIRQVWSYNLDFEFAIIRAVVRRYPFVSMDTEFPGVVFAPSASDGTPAALTHRHGLRGPRDQYRFLKRNVDALKLIQVGLTFSDAGGNLPGLGTSTTGFIWEFNFAGFNAARDPHSPESVALLRCQGVDLERNREEGVDCRRFAQLMLTSGLLFNQSVTWVTFHSAYDFGYLVKILTRRHLPSRLEDFLGLLRTFFGDRVYDIKHMIRFCDSLYGGLERVAKTLQVNRTVGKCHQAGSDSLLTWLAFRRMRDLFFVNPGPEKLAGVLYGLDIPLRAMH